MTQSSNAPLPQNAYTQQSGISSTASFSPVFMIRAPTTNDVNYSVKQLWVDTLTGDTYVLISFAINNEIKTANWLIISGQSAQVETLTGDDGVVIDPDVNQNINIDGLVVANATNPKAIFTKNTSASTMSIEGQVSAAIASTDVTKVGLSAFDSGAFNVDANGFVTLKGGTEAIDSVNVDASTGPGTNPVLPAVNGSITVTGGQVAAGTVGANVIRTDSLAANTYTTQIQRAAAVSSSNSVNNGVAHFNTATSSIDSNGFMSPFQLAKWVVNPTAGLGTHQTITAALAAASSGDYVLVTQGTYTENFTLPAGITLSGMPGAADIPCTVVNGTITYSSAGNATISSIGLQTNSAFALIVSGSNNCQLTIDNCNLNCLNNTGIQVTNSNASTTINLYNCSGDLATTGIGLYSMSGTNAATLLYFQGCFFTNSGNSVTPSNNSSGDVQILLGQTASPLSTTSTGSFQGFLSYFFINNLAVNNLNVNSSTSCSLEQCTIVNPNNTVAPITVGGSGTLAILSSEVGTLNTNWIDGTGTIGYAGVSVTAGATIAGTLTANKNDFFSGNLKP